MKVRKVRNNRTVLQTDRGMRAQHHGTPYVPWADEEAVVPAGLTWFRAKDGYITPLKGARTSGAVAASALIQLQPSWSFVFGVGDALATANRVSMTEFSGAWDGTEVVEISLDGGNVRQVDLARYGGTVDSPAAAAAAFAYLIGDSGLDNVLKVMTYVNSDTGNAEVWLLVRDMYTTAPATVAITVNGGTGAASAPGPFAKVDLGTVVSVDTENDVITLDQANDLPPGLPILADQPGVSYDSLKAGGITPEEMLLCLANSYGLFTSITVSLEEMYWDSRLEKVFPEVNSL